MPNTQQIGERIAYHRKRAGLSQVEFAGLVKRSESWVSQVERGVRQVDRNSVLQKVADVLSVSMAELRGEDDSLKEPEERSKAFDGLRLALTGHPAIGTVLDVGTSTRPSSQFNDRDYIQQHEKIWELLHSSRYAELAPILANLITDLEMTVRTVDDTSRNAVHNILGDTYQATAAMMAKLGETDAAWIAADRAGEYAEKSDSPLAVAASMFRMAHVFLTLGQIDQAYHVAHATAQALRPMACGQADPATLSLFGALHLVLAVAAARDNDRVQAYQHLKTARETAEAIGDDRDDYGTEFGPTNVAIHAVSIAVELGDAGHAIELSREVQSQRLSPERQARYLLDLAYAHVMRRQIGEALHVLQDAERIAPEETRVHHRGRAIARDLLQLSTKPRPELRELAVRFGVLP